VGSSCGPLALVSGIQLWSTNFLTPYHCKFFQAQKQFRWSPGNELKPKTMFTHSLTAYGLLCCHYSLAMFTHSINITLKLQTKCSTFNLINKRFNFLWTFKWDTGTYKFFLGYISPFRYIYKIIHIRETNVQSFMGWKEMFNYKSKYQLSKNETNVQSSI